MVDNIHFCASELDQGLHHRHVSVLRRDVQRRPPVLRTKEEPQKIRLEARIQ